MNIIKLKDVIHPTDENFNIKLKGKYAYWIQMRYIVAFEDLTYTGYIRAEQDIKELEGLYYLDVYDCGNEDCLYQYVDMDETNRINDINEYIVKNNFQPDADITINELKIFRTWLAKALLSFDVDMNGKPMYKIYDEKTTHMLNYYANGMYDDIIKFINMYLVENISYYDSKLTGCACCGDTNISSLYNTKLTVCDSEEMYRNNIYNYMCDVFSNIDFWNQFAKEFLMEFKKYIDNIIRYNLPLYKSKYISEFIDCDCTVESDMQAKLMGILQSLSISLGYMINDNINGHKNYILDSFISWSKLLYENMEWV